MDSELDGKASVDSVEVNTFVIECGVLGNVLSIGNLELSDSLLVSVDSVLESGDWVLKYEDSVLGDMAKVYCVVSSILVGLVEKVVGSREKVASLVDILVTVVRCPGRV